MRHTEKAAEVRLISYKQFCTEEPKHPLRQYEIPISHSISLAIPTLRAGSPGYARFASPAERTPDKPQVQASPDRWWVFSAVDFHLLLYALCSAVPLASDRVFETVTLDQGDTPLSVLKQRIHEIEESMNEVAPLFFRGEPGERSSRTRLHELLRQHMPSAL